MVPVDLNVLDPLQAVTIVNILEVSHAQHGNLMSLIDWKSSSLVEIDVQPVDTYDLFSRTKTYWLVGLTGSLGLSLCEWMIKHGAKYVVLSSRNPKIDPRWEQDMAAYGAVVKILARYAIILSLCIYPY